MNSSRERSISNKRAASQHRGHIVQQSLNKKSELIDKYQTQIQTLIEKIDSGVPAKRNSINSNNISLSNSAKIRNVARNRLASSLRNQTLEMEKEVVGVGSMKDYQKLILGLEYALESERKKTETLTQKNNSLELEVYNLRNVLVGPNQAKQFEKTIVKQLQDKINNSQDRLLQQKRNYEFIIESKNEAIVSLQGELRVLQKDYEAKINNKQAQRPSQSKENSLTKKILQLMSAIQQQRTTITTKNILIQSLKYRKVQFHADSGDQSDDQIKRIRKLQRIKFYQEQLQIANKMVIKKNIEILNISNKLMKYQEVIQLLELYLDKKEAKNVDLDVLETPVVTKLRVLLREKATFERELMSQMNQQQKKMTLLQNQQSSRDSLTAAKLSETISDNKKLTSLVTSLQINIKNLQKSFHQQKRENQYLKDQIQITKKQFVDEIKRLKGQLGTISSVTKNEFDRMKLQNLKLSEQNRSLLFLVGEKEKDIHRNGQIIKTFEDYKQKINSLDLNINQTEKRKNQRTPEQSPQIGSKLLLVSTFSGWMFEWNKIKSWNNKKVLLNLILDKQQIRKDAFQSMKLLIDIIHQCLLHSKSIEVQQRAIILLHYFLREKILKHQSLYLDKIVPILIRGFRQKIQGEESQKLRLLNQSTLKIFTQLQKQTYLWTHELTNQMLSVNGLKYLFTLITESPIDDLVQMAYDVLIMITKQNQMVSFMISFNVVELILLNLNSKYHLIIFLLELLKNLLQSDDFMRAQKSFLQYRKLTLLLKQDSDQEVLTLTLDCLEILMQKSTSFSKSLHKIQTISILNSLIKTHTDYRLLKKIAQIYGLVVDNFDEDSLQKFVIKQVQTVLRFIKDKNITDQRFLISLKIVLKVVGEITDKNDMDQKIISPCFQLYELYESLEEKARLRLNQIVDVIYQRNKIVINKFSSDSFLTNLVQSYKSTHSTEEIMILLKILLFQNQQKHATQILRAGRQIYIDKLITDCTQTKNYPNLLAIAREKYIQKFITIKIVSKVVTKLLKQRSQQEYLGLVVSVLYFLSKNQQVSLMVVESKAVEKIAEVMMERHDKEALLHKCFALLELLHTMNYKKKVLNHFISNDPKMLTLKTFNYILRRAQNKTEMGERALFFYDYLMDKGVTDSLTILMEANEWMVDDMIQTRNQYIGKVDPLVYKIQMILNSVCEKSNRLKKIYQRFKIEGDVSQGDEN